jgi:hypothetical protein
MVHRSQASSYEIGRRQPPRRRWPSKQALIVGAILAVGFGTGIWGLTWTLSRHVPAASQATTLDTDVRTGTIVDGAKGQCRYFDNTTGRTSTMETDCEALAREKEGSGLRGTKGRINAISKSFVNK